MRYRGFTITATDDNGIVREEPKSGRMVICEGYYCQIVPSTDFTYDLTIDDFCLAVGFEIPDSSYESLELGIRAYVDENYPELWQGKENVLRKQKDRNISHLAHWLMGTQDHSVLHEALSRDLCLEPDEILELGFTELVPHFDRTGYACVIADHIVDTGSEGTENGKWRVTFKGLNNQFETDLPTDAELLTEITERLRHDYPLTVSSVKCSKNGFVVEFDPVCCPRVAVPKLPSHEEELRSEDGVSVVGVSAERNGSHRWKELAGRVLDYVSEYFQDCDLYDILHHTLELSHEEIEALGFSLYDQYELENEEQELMDSSDTDPLSSYKTAELVATYEELFQVPDEERITYYFGDLGGHFFNHGVTAEQKKAAYEKALAVLELDSDTFQQANAFIHRGGIIDRMREKMENGQQEQAASSVPELSM